MTAMTADRMAALRQALAEATRAEEREPILAEIIDLAAELSQPGAQDAAEAGLGLDEALAQLRAPAADDDAALTLYLTAVACLVRDCGSDLDDAIAGLIELREMLLADAQDPGPDAELAEILAEIEAKLGVALLRRASGPDGRVADLDAAATAYGVALGLMADDDERRPALVAGLALQCAMRYAGFGGSDEHRTAALAHAEAGLAARGAAEDATAACHIVIAWMALTRQLTGEQRSEILARPKIGAVRGGGPEAAAILADLGRMEIAVSDAEIALGHLCQVPQAAVTDEQLRDVVPVMSSLAVFVIRGAGGQADDIDWVADGLRRAAGRPGAEEPEPGELLGMRAALLATGTGQNAEPDELKPAADALQEAATRLPEGHAIRGPLLDELREAIGRQVTAAESAGDIVAEVERIVQALEQMPRDAEAARTLAAAAVNVLGLQLAHRSGIPFERVIGQLEQAMTRLPAEDPLRPVAECLYWAAMGGMGSKQNRPEVVEAAEEGLHRCADQTPAGSVVRPYVLLGVAFALVERYAMTGELRCLDQAEAYLKKADAESAAIGGPAVPGQDSAMALYLRGLVQLARSHGAMDGQDLAQSFADLERAVGLTGPEHPLRPRLVATLETIRALGELRPAEPGPPSMGQPARQAFETIRAEARRMVRDHPDFPGLAGQAAGGLMLQGIADGDAAALGQAISLLAEACSVPGLTYRERPRLLNMHGSALLTRYLLTRDRRDLSHAIDRLEEARRAVEQEIGSPYAAEVLQSLASAYRARGDASRGDVRRAVAVGLDSLRERAGNVLLQDSDRNALAAARRTTSDADEMARWFLRRDQSGAAIEALELGRGTVLHAATSGTGLAEALEDAGRADLAAEWAAATAGGVVDSDRVSDLRSRIMLAIEGSPAEVRLLSPPPVGDICAALRQGGADALVYLLPRGDDGRGVAVLVESGGTVGWLSLPGLHTEVSSPATACLRARRAADAAGRAPGAAAAAWRQALGELCDWAWRVAIGPVLAAVPGRRGDMPHIVLVPGGELGLVAWHAARRAAGGGHRYAAQEAVISYASSARQFVEGAGRRPRPWAAQPVLIADAAASAYSTEMGICQLYAEHYPRAAVFGHAHERLTSGGGPAIPGRAAATSADVLAALPHEAFPGASLLHFGCHGRARVPVLGSHLDLGAGNTVDVADVLRGARRRAGPVSGGLVVLASCLTDVAEADYDEALTLATAFLSAGASRGGRGALERAGQRHRPVHGGLPPFPERDRAVPARALRSAQLWMLDPGRTAPGALPAVLARRGYAVAGPGRPGGLGGFRISGPADGPSGLPRCVR